MPQQLVVRGIISDPQQRPVPGVVVRAFDKELPSLKRDQLLGDATTDAEGRYEIAFSDDRFLSHERERADLYVEVARPRDGTPLGRSPVHFNAEREQRIDVTIDGAPDGATEDRRSEYEQLVDSLLPLAGPVPLGNLTAEDVEFLVGETGADLRRVAWLAAAARLARQTEVPAEAFYGWARREGPLPDEWARVPETREADPLRELLRGILSRLAATPRGELREALLAAIDRNIIPRSLRERIDEIVRDLVRSPYARHQAIGRLRDDASGAPLAGAAVRVLDLEADGAPEEIGRETTNDDGLFVIAFGTPGRDMPAARRLRLAVLDESGREVWATDVRVATDQRDVLDFRTPARRPPEPEEHALARLVAAARIPVSEGLLPFLAERNIHTLRGLRQAGGLARLAGVPGGPENAAVRLLDAHADLSRVSSDPATNAALIEKGFRSVADIAAMPRPAFVRAMHETTGDYKAAKLQVAARAQISFLHHVVTAAAVERANGYAPPVADGVAAAAEGAGLGNGPNAATQPTGAAPDPLPEKCGCSDCEAAVSPAAYLADLLGYAAVHLEENGNGTTLAFLENTFHQPFGDLPTDCQAIEELVRQVRLCIEVLRSYMRAHPIGPAETTLLDEATHEYLLSAYRLLLIRFGTSYEKVRLARAASREERQALAEQIGIGLTEPRPDPLTTPGDELDQLFLDPDAAPADARALTEPALERLFGLVDTTRDPLSDGVKIGDAAVTPELGQWRFAGARWSHNTDAEGLVHLRVSTAGAGPLASEIEAYRDAGRTALVASGQAGSPSGDRTVKLVATNASGLSGLVTVTGTSALNTDISVALVPKLLAWRLRQLRTLWRRMDFPTDVYSQEYLPSADRRAVIDPDVIGPDDFRHPDATNPLFALWRTRRLWVDQRLQDLASLTRVVVVEGRAVTVPDLDRVFASMSDQLAYGASSVTPWLPGTPVTEFDALADTLERGATAEVSAATARLAKDLNLSVDAFLRLLRIRAKQRQWESDPKGEMVQPEEWSEVFSILTRAQKGRLVATWIQEEEAAAVRLGPADFWRSLHEPREGDWPPVRTAGHPLVDPDEVKLTDLPEPTAGREAIQLWQARRAALTSATAALQDERESNGFDATLRLGLGHPAPGNPLQHDLGAIRSDLASSNPATVTAATEKIQRDLHLTVERFNRVMTMKEQAAPASPRKPTAAEWAELYALLTAAHKVKHLYPAWVAEEGAAGLSSEYWRAVKARLPRVRASAEERQAWRQGLEARSKPPVVDPDMVDVATFNGPGAASPIALWQARHDWVKTTIAGLAAEPRTLAGLDAMVGQAVSVPMADLLALDESREKGDGVQSRLDQLTLGNAAFVYLLEVRKLLLAGQPLTSAEWENVYSILVQVAKLRRRAEWRDEERLADVTLSPDSFVPPDTLPAALDATPLRWRAALDERRDWLDTLQSRADQERSALVSFHDVVSGVEEGLLPTLRDALVAAVGAGADASSKGAWVTDRLLIDAKAGGCQKTTRTAQAIETVQGLLFAARTSQSAALQPLKLTLEAPDFDEEWRWIGSYATWRSAMFVFMYPENVAVPSLRRRQTPAFRALVKAVRGSRGVTADQACGLAAEYAAYYEDVARLAIGATAQAMVTQPSGTRCVPGTIAKKPLVLMFGRGGVSGKLYWSTFDPTDAAGYGQSFWDLVPGAPPTLAVLGAVVYERSATDRRVFLFVRSAEYKVQFLTLDLESLDWAGPTDLGLPAGDPRYIDVAVNQSNSAAYTPMLMVRVGADFFQRRLNPEGSGWVDGDWKQFQLDNYSLNLNGIQQLLAAADGSMWVREGGYIEQRHTLATQGAISTSSPAAMKDAEYVGAVLWGSAKNAFHSEVVQKQTSGDYSATASASYQPHILDKFPTHGLKVIAPNSGYVTYASFAYERRNVGLTLGTKPREQDGVYLRLDELEQVLTGAPLKSMRYRITPRVIPKVSGQFAIPARLEGAALDARRNTVKITLSASSSSATNRAYAEEAYFFVPMLLADALRRGGEYVAALDWLRTVFDYASLPGKRKIYHGLIEEESLSALYKRTADWLRDPLDPHAIAATRRLTYTRFTLLSIVRLLLEFADEEFTRDTPETVPQARALYLAALFVLDLPELKQRLGSCDDVIGSLDIAPGPEAPAAAAVAVTAIINDLAEIKDAGSLKSLAPKVQSALGGAGGWAERVTRARALVEEAVAAEPPSPTVSRALEVGTAATAHAFSAVLASPAIDGAAEHAGHLAETRFRSSLSAATGVQEAALEAGGVELPWLRDTALSRPVREVDFVLDPALQVVAPLGSPSYTGLVYAGIGPDGVDPALDLADPPQPAPNPAPAPTATPVGPVVVPSLAFCIPPNPLLASLRLHAELNLHKIRTCRNIAGMKRELEPYAAPTDTVSGLPTIGAGGRIALPGMNVLRPTLYRYSVLIQRAKELLATAQQLEAAMLSAFEKRDAEAYSILRARQDLELAQAGVQLEILRLKQANDGVTLASLQQTRAELQFDHFQRLLDEGMIELERGAIETLGEAAIFQATAADWSFAAAAVYGAAAVAGAVAGGAVGSVKGGPLGTALGGSAGAVVGALSGGLGGVASGLSALSSGYSSLAAKRSTRAQIQLTLASFERRRQEWELSVSLAKQDVAIGAQQVAIAVDAVDIVKQEKVIAEVRNTHAKDTVTFLANKFTNVDLYDWMGGVLQDVYGFFLQQATSTARLAENQLAFERQEPPAALIQGDYWEAPGDALGFDGAQGAATDRRGLTGSSRLLQDLYRLDQYAFETNKRKLHLSKTISVALMAPTEFQRFRETGVLRFATPMDLFDRDFPGHYLRLIRSVRVSVVALIPPTQGIHASLATSGVSRVVIGPDVFQTVLVRRDPELVALTSPVNATGVFDLDAQASGMLLPFEGSGVDTTWEFRMPKAANFLDYRMVADLLFTIDLTALHSWDYSQQVIQSLRQSLSAERPFSFRNQLADQWYDLHNPDQTSRPMVVRFRMAQEDFPPNVDALKIQHVVLFFMRKNGTTFEVPVSHLRFTEDGSAGPAGGAATSVEGVVSTRRGNAGSWMSFVGKRPVGEWELSLPDSEEMRNRFRSEDIQDILFVVTYGGRTHEWPA